MPWLFADLAFAVGGTVELWIVKHEQHIVRGDVEIYQHTLTPTHPSRSHLRLACTLRQSSPWCSPLDVSHAWKGLTESSAGTAVRPAVREALLVAQSRRTEVECRKLLAGSLDAL